MAAVGATDFSPTLRLARASDVDAVSELMRSSIQALFPAFYSAEQTASAAVYVGDLDLLLISDGTYFVAEAGDDIVACGGWSRRNKLYAGEGDAADDDRLLDPLREPARIRAMFVRGNWTRRGLGKAILTECEDAARREGFTALTLGATLPGVPLYRAFGFVEKTRLPLVMPDGVTLEIAAMDKEIAAEPAT